MVRRYAILDLNDNLGEVKTDGIDVSLNARLGRSTYGDFNVLVRWHLDPQV